MVPTLTSFHKEALKAAIHERRNHYIPQAFESNVSFLLPWDVINTLLWSARFESPRLRLHKDGDTIEASTYTKRSPLRRGSSLQRICDEAFYKALSDGATLVLDAVEELHAPLNEFVKQLEHFLRDHVQVNAYASWRETRGFSTHWDDHDVVIIQIYGPKHWYLFGHTRKDPMYRDFHVEEAPPPTPTWERVIEAGDLLFIPRGCWHHAIALNKPSLHLTFGITSRSGAHVLQWLQKKLTKEAFFRCEIPRFDKEKQKHYFNIFKKHLINQIKETDLQACTEYWDEHRERRSLFSLPWAVKNTPLPKNVWVRLNAGGVYGYIKDEANQVIRFRLHHKELTLHIKCAPFINILKDNEWHSFTSLINQCSPLLTESECSDLLQNLLRQGLMAVKEGNT
jgi:hypothetical protein